MGTWYEDVPAFYALKFRYDPKAWTWEAKIVADEVWRFVCWLRPRRRYERRISYAREMLYALRKVEADAGSLITFAGGTP